MANNTEKLSNQLNKQIAKGGGINLVGTAFGRLVQFGTYILIARFLGPNSYGFYVLGFTILQITTQISILGLQHGLVRFIPIFREEGDTERIKGTLILAFSIAVFISIIIAIILRSTSSLLATSVFNEVEFGSLLKIFAIALPFFVLIELAAHSARASHRMGYYVGIRKIIWPTLSAILIGISLLLGFGIFGVLGGFLISVILTALLGTYLLVKKLYPEIRYEQADYVPTRILRFAIPSLLIGFSSLILLTIDRFSIGYFMNPADVGIYDAASRIANQLSLILISFNMAFAPLIPNLTSQERTCELRELFQQVTRWSLTFTLPLFLVLILFPNQLMNLFGNGFLEGNSVLVILALASLINSAAGSVGLVLIMSGNQDIELGNGLGMAILNGILNIWLVQLYGILGAAIATSASIALLNAIRVMEVYWIFHIQPFTSKWIKPFIAGSITFSLVTGLRIWREEIFFTFLLIPGCLLIYVVILSSLGLEPEDVTIMRDLQTRFSKEN